MSLYSLIVESMFGMRDEKNLCPGCRKFDPENLIEPCCSQEALRRANEETTRDDSP